LVLSSVAPAARCDGLLICSPIRPRAPAAGVTIYGGRRASNVLGLPPAPSERHEYGTMEVTLELVDSLEEAIAHIHAYGSGHTEAILTGEARNVRLLVALRL
jgi:gamma-glutamyl phosphate reductase